MKTVERVLIGGGSRTRLTNSTVGLDQQPSDARGNCGKTGSGWTNQSKQASNSCSSWELWQVMF